MVAPAGLGRSDHLNQRDRDRNPEQHAPGSGEDEQQRGGVETATAATAPKFNLVQTLAMVVTFAGLQVAWLAGIVYVAVRLQADIF